MEEIKRVIHKAKCFIDEGDLVSVRDMLDLLPGPFIMLMDRVQELELRVKVLERTNESLERIIQNSIRGD